MRGRLLDATVDCLAKRGWAELSTNDIVRRARVSRGALAHHFPTKASLALAAAERVIEQRAAEFRTTFLRLPPERHTVAEAVDLLWDFYRGPGFACLAELMVAARTNRELRAALRDGPERITETAFEVFIDVFPAMADNAHARTAVRAALALLTGLAIQAFVEGRHTDHAAEILEAVKLLAGMFLALPPTAEVMA